MEGCIRVARQEEISERQGKLVKVGDEEIALFRVGSDIVAVGNVCPHQRFSKIHEGEVSEGIVTCPMHGWRFDLRTGRSVNNSGRLKWYRTGVNKGEVWIEAGSLNEQGKGV
ncbi:MAG TPA: Rieske 2Fe-2S domain-containing protein [Bacteroidota bacterium]|nr:Rieske 2Fe-2S domain-containing protein [Bacteroidota bacterium]